MLLFVSLSPESGLQAFEMLHQNAKSKFPEAGRVIGKRSNEGLRRDRPGATKAGPGLFIFSKNTVRGRGFSPSDSC